MYFKGHAASNGLSNKYLKINDFFLVKDGGMLLKIKMWSKIAFFYWNLSRSRQKKTGARGGKKKLEPEPVKNRPAPQLWSLEYFVYLQMKEEKGSRADELSPSRNESLGK